MDDLIKQREQNKVHEQRQVNSFMKMIYKQRESFQFADISQQIAHEKNEEDLVVLSDTLTKWNLKIKNDDPRKKELESLLFSVWRVMAYSQSLETVSKTAVSYYMSVEKRNTQLASDIRLVELKSQQEIDKLKNEIETLKRENKALTNGEI